MARLRKLEARISSGHGLRQDARQSVPWYPGRRCAEEAVVLEFFPGWPSKMFRQLPSTCRAPGSESETPGPVGGRIKGGPPAHARPAGRSRQGAPVVPLAAPNPIPNCSWQSQLRAAPKKKNAAKDRARSGSSSRPSCCSTVSTLAAQRRLPILRRHQANTRSPQHLYYCMLVVGIWRRAAVRSMPGSTRQCHHDLALGALTNHNQSDPRSALFTPITGAGPGPPARRQLHPHLTLRLAAIFGGVWRVCIEEPVAGRRWISPTASTWWCGRRALRPGPGLHCLAGHPASCDLRAGAWPAVWR